jgi:hypothetical protein
LKIPRLRGSRLQSVHPAARPRSTGRRNCLPLGATFCSHCDPCFAAGFRTLGSL